MVKRRTQYTAIGQKIAEINNNTWTINICARTKKAFENKINCCMTIDCHLLVTWRETSFRSNGKLVRPNRVIIRSLIRTQTEYPASQHLAKLAQARSISKIWHRWNQLLGSIIPEGFQVLTNKYEAIPTALSIRQQLKSLIPTPYNCYLLDSLSETLRERDIRRYLGLALRHD
jgi:hypothetical protein